MNIDENERWIGVFSFPRSGNTWMRTLLCRALNYVGPLSTGAPDLRADRLPGDVLSDDQGARFRFFKSHERWLPAEQDGVPRTDCVIYLYRNPFDVFLSQASLLLRVRGHQNPALRLRESSLEACSSETIHTLFSVFATFGTLAPNFTEAGSWFEHVGLFTSLSEMDGVPLVLVRYEDLVSSPMETLAETFREASISVSDLESALASVDRETAVGSDPFFWRRSVDFGAPYLDAAIRQQFCTREAHLLERLGYQTAHFT